MAEGKPEKKKLHPNTEAGLARSRGHGKRATAHEMNERIDTVANLMIKCYPRRQLVKFCLDTYGVSEVQAAKYINRATEKLKEDADVDRQGYLASRLQTLDLIATKSIETGQLAAGIGAIRLQAELAGIGASNQPKRG